MSLQLRPLLRYAFAAGAVALGFGLYLGLSAWVGSDLPTFITFYPAVMVAALAGGLRPGLFATVLVALGVEYWIQHPRGLFSVSSLHDGVALGLFCFMGAFISTVAHLYRRDRPKAAAYDQEQALRETRREKEFLAKLLEDTSQPFAVGYPDGRIGRLNHAFEQLTGYSAAELRALDWSATLTPPEWRELEKQKLDELQRTGQPVRYEKEYVRRDGSRVPVELLVHLARDAEGKAEYYYSFLTDITERRRAEQAARASAEHLRQLNAELQAANENLAASRRAALNLMDDAVTARQQGEQASADLRQEAIERGLADQAARAALERYQSFLEVTGQVGWTTNADGLVTEDMPAWRAFTGQSVEDIQGWGWAKALHPEDVARTAEVWQRAVQDRTHYETEYRLRRHDGVYRDFLARGVPSLNTDGSIREWVGTCIDITERQLAEQALRESESFYRQTLESIPGMVFTTRPDGYCDYQSQQWVEFTGVPMSEHLGDGWNRLLHPDDRPRAFAAWRDAVDGRAPYDLEYRVRRHDGEYEWFKVRGRPIRDAAGQIVRWFGTVLNIEELKRTEEHLKASLREKEVLLQEIHHRVKNNLQVISSLINLQADVGNQPALRASLEDVRDRVRTMALVHEKLYQSGDLARLNFADYAASLLHYLWRAHGEVAAKVRLNLATQPVTLPVGIAVPCGLILNELASNALKHAFQNRSDGEVTVGLSHDAPTNQVCLWVGDNGVGLPAGLNWRESRSLGLRLVQMLAQQLRGSVEVGREGGTEFRVTFAVSEA